MDTKEAPQSTRVIPEDPPWLTADMAAEMVQDMLARGRRKAEEAAKERSERREHLISQLEKYARFKKCPSYDEEPYEFARYFLLRMIVEYQDTGKLDNFLSYLPDH